MVEVPVGDEDCVQPLVLYALLPHIGADGVGIYPGVQQQPLAARLDQAASGLKLEIEYAPNFFLDAWRIQRVELEIDFGFWETWAINYLERGQKRTRIVRQMRHAPGFPKVIPFINGALLNEQKKVLTLITDGFLMPK